MAAIAGELVGEFLRIADAEDLGRGVVTETPGGKRDGGHQGFQMAGRQVDDQPPDLAFLHGGQLRRNDLDGGLVLLNGTADRGRRGLSSAVLPWAAAVPAPWAAVGTLVAPPVPPRWPSSRATIAAIAPGGAGSGIDGAPPRPDKVIWKPRRVIV